jgi:hypothetical protein
MLTTERHFRIVQLFCILEVLTCLRVSLKVHKTSPGMTPTHWFLIVMALWAIFAGFALERRILHGPATGRRSSRSTPLSRWRAANLVRVGSAVSVACWGLLLRDYGGPAWIVYLTFAVAGFLLLLWSPGRPPQADILSS